MQWAWTSSREGQKKPEEFAPSSPRQQCEEGYENTTDINMYGMIDTLLYIVLNWGLSLPGFRVDICSTRVAEFVATRKTTRVPTEGAEHLCEWNVLVT